MCPILFTFFGIKVYASPFFLTLAIIVGVIVGKSEAKRRGFLPSDFTTYWTAAIPVTFLLAALNATLVYRGLAGANGPGSLLSNGVVSFGAVIGMLGLGFVQAKLRKKPVTPTLDTISLILPLILGIYRIGCFLRGCCYGVETTSILGLNLPDVHGHWAARYPTQLMLMIFDFGLYAVLRKWSLKNPPGGSITCAFLISICLCRLFVDGLRELPAVYGTFSLHQLSSLAILMIALYFAFKLRLQPKSNP